MTDEGNSLPLDFTYVPGGNSMPSRLVAEVNGEYRGWAALFSGLAAETSDGQIVWHFVP